MPEIAIKDVSNTCNATKRYIIKNGKSDDSSVIPFYDIIHAINFFYIVKNFSYRKQNQFFVNRFLRNINTTLFIFSNLC